MDCSPPDSSAHGILQTRALEWGAIAFIMKYQLLPNQLRQTGRMQELTERPTSPPSPWLQGEACLPAQSVPTLRRPASRGRRRSLSESRGARSARGPWTDGRGGLQGMGLQGVGHDCSHLSLSAHVARVCSVWLCGPVGCSPAGSYPWDFVVKKYGSGSPFPSPGELHRVSHRSGKFPSATQNPLGFSAWKHCPTTAG